MKKGKKVLDEYDVVVNSTNPDTGVENQIVGTAVSYPDGNLHALLNMPTFLKLVNQDGTVKLKIFKLHEPRETKKNVVAK